MTLEITQEQYDLFFQIHTDTISKNEKALEILELEEHEESQGLINLGNNKFILVFEDKYGSLIHITKINDNELNVAAVAKNVNRERLSYIDAVDYAKRITNGDGEHPKPMLNEKYRTLAIAECKDTIERYKKALANLQTATII